MYAYITVQYLKHSLHMPTVAHFLASGLSVLSPLLNGNVGKAAHIIIPDSDL